ncbi:hypothetical protein COY23_00565 [bacterium (Candidatus Torokbacteria) CG_4_10_14_0_2_um_filter_35_8]|nr:MAG: hypothetical protein COY23_00565 [bacterium (Candidatus Torokbacteria) CG_4_10_14_0_2_um_filter_35_8]
MSKNILHSWKNTPLASRVEEGSSKNFKTGSWRSKKPVHNKEICTNCLQCWINCPDNAIKVKDGNIDKIDYDFCKGCGICAEVCPVKAIEMKNEKDE